MKTSHQVKKPRYSLLLYLNPGNCAVHFRDWRKLWFLFKLGWGSWRTSCPKTIFARADFLLAMYRFSGVMSDQGKEKVKAGRADKEGERAEQGFWIFSNWSTNHSYQQDPLFYCQCSWSLLKQSQSIRTLPRSTEDF